MLSVSVGCSSRVGQISQRKVESLINGGSEFMTVVMR